MILRIRLTTIVARHEEANPYAAVTVTGGPQIVLRDCPVLCSLSASSSSHCLLFKTKTNGWDVTVIAGNHVVSYQLLSRFGVWVDVAFHSEHLFKMWKKGDVNYYGVDNEVLPELVHLDRENVPVSLVPMQKAAASMNQAP